MTRHLLGLYQGRPGARNVIEEYEAGEVNKKVIIQKYSGYTQQEIAKDLGISQSKVSRILAEFRDYLIEVLKKD